MSKKSSKTSPVPVPDNSSVHRPARRRLMYVVTIGLVGLLSIPLVMWLVSRTTEPIDTYLVTWQALLDDPSATELLKVLKEAPAQDPDWKPDNTSRSRHGGMAPPENAAKAETKYYRGSGEDVRGAMQRVLASSATTFLQDAVRWDSCYRFNPSQSVGNSLEMFGRLISGQRQILHPGVSFLADGLWLGNSLEQWRQANNNFFNIMQNLPCSTTYDSARRLQLLVQGNIQIRDFKFNQQPGASESAASPIDCNAVLKPGETLVFVTRFPVKFPAPVLVTVTERVDLPHGRTDIIQQRSFTRWIQGGPELVRKTASALDTWEKEAPENEILPAAKWTQTLPDGRALTLFAVSLNQKYPNFKWTPEGKPLPGVVPNFGSDLVSLEEKSNSPQCLFRIVESAPAEIGTQAILASDLEWIGRRIGEGAFYAITKNPVVPGPSGPSFAQFAGLTARTLPDGKGELEVVAGYGPWKPLGKAPVEEPSPTSVATDQKPFQVHLHEFNQLGVSKLGVNLSVFQKVPPEEELRLLLVTKSGQQIQGNFPPGIYPLNTNSARIRTGYQQFTGYKKLDIDHFEIETRPTKTLRFTGFATEPEELKKLLAIIESPSK